MTYASNGMINTTIEEEKGLIQSQSEELKE